jgi:hypothetical protein
MCRLSSWTSTSASSFRMLSAPPAGARPISSQKSTCNSCSPGAYKIRINIQRTWLFWDITPCRWMNGSRHSEEQKFFHYDPRKCQKKLTLWHSITSQKNGIPRNTVVTVSTLTKPTAFDFKLPHKFGLFNIYNGWGRRDNNIYILF